MNELKVQDFHGKQVIDSRDVAQMVERGHNELLKSIRTYIGYFGEGEIAHTEFFIESTYLDKQGKPNPCYLITKKGCDMIANKTTGKKGVLFTAAYVTAFEKMRQELELPKLTSLPEGVSLSGLVKLVNITRRALLDAGGTPHDVCGMIKETFEAVGFPVPSTLPKQLPGQISLFDRQTVP